VGGGVDGSREAPCCSEEWGGAWGPAQRSGGACVVGSGARGLCACGGLPTEAKTGRRGTVKWGPGTVTSSGI
jgi:hypothetical protein